MQTTCKFDGSCWPNPGCRGGWAFIIDGPIKEYGYGAIERPKPTLTNNEAEFIALTRLLEKLDELGIQQPAIYGDSKLVVNIASRKWRSRAPHLAPYAEKCRELADKLDAEVSWIPRRKNTSCDEMCKWG